MDEPISNQGPAIVVEDAAKAPAPKKWFTRQDRWALALYIGYFLFMAKFNNDDADMLTGFNVIIHEPGYLMIVLMGLMFRIMTGSWIYRLYPSKSEKVRGTHE